MSESCWEPPSLRGLSGLTERAGCPQLGRAGGQVVRDAAAKASVGAGLAGVGAAEREAPCADRSLLVGGRGQKNNGGRKTTQVATHSTAIKALWP